MPRWSLRDSPCMPARERGSLLRFWGPDLLLREVLSWRADFWRRQAASRILTWTTSSPAAAWPTMVGESGRPAGSLPPSPPPLPSSSVASGSPRCRGVARRPPYSRAAQMTSVEESQRASPGAVRSAQDAREQVPCRCLARDAVCAPRHVRRVRSPSPRRKSAYLLSDSEGTAGIPVGDDLQPFGPHLCLRRGPRNEQGGTASRRPENEPSGRGQQMTETAGSEAPAARSCSKKHAEAALRMARPIERGGAWL